MSALLVLLLAASPAAKKEGPFEGVLEFRLAVQGGEGSVTTQVSALGVRSHATVKYLDQAKETTVVVRARDADVTWVWEPSTKRFDKLVSPAQPRRQFTVETKGEATVAQVKCRVVVLTSAEGASEYCSAVGFVGDVLRESLVSQAQRLAPDVEAALRSANALGLVVRLKQTSPDGKVVTGFELVKARREKIDRGLFELAR